MRTASLHPQRLPLSYGIAPGHSFRAEGSLDRRAVTAAPAHPDTLGRLVGSAPIAALGNRGELEEVG